MLALFSHEQVIFTNKSQELTKKQLNIERKRGRLFRREVSTYIAIVRQVGIENIPGSLEAIDPI